ncbi:MAG TPA: phosphoketolase family protein [Planctomycetota bacterium]|jgi:xylulose-5-phosphate/fructose-6-phosphate phosphoketolase
MSTVLTAENNRQPAIATDDIEALKRYQRAVNYLAAAEIYLQGNVLLEEPLRSADIKERLLGHWGTCPGINLIYCHLNQLIRRTSASVLLITGPGHGAAANLANMYLEGTLSEFYPGLTLDRAGLDKFIRAFSWPGGFPSHLNPALPGVIHEGGELGYALATAFGSVLDNPDLITACIIGDGEAETGPTATAWHSTKFLNPLTDGAVLPILHLNGYKISSPTIFGTMTNDELQSLFTGYGWSMHLVEHSPRINEDMQEALTRAFDEINRIQQQVRGGVDVLRPRWPMLVLRTPKGWTGPREIDGHPIEGSFRAHQVPGKDLKNNPQHLQAIERWLRSYKPEELWDKLGRPAEDIRNLCPSGCLRMAMNPHAYGGKIRKPLELPPIQKYELRLDGRGGQKVSGMENVGRYLAEVVETDANFRIFCPDELESNRLHAVLDATERQYVWPLPPNAEHIGQEGRVMEMLSEHNCQGWLQGYLLTGRHGLFPCYEAFIPIVDGMMNQYAKFLKTSLEVPWRRPISSLNYLATSEAWRQDHNGYSHQGPGFLNNLLTKKGHTYRVYLPPDGNCLLSTLDHCLRSTNYINLIVAGKQPMPQWLELAEAIEHCRVGASVWRWASTNDGEDPEILLAGCGDNLTMEVMGAAQILREETPAWRVRVVNVTDLMVLGIPQKYPHGLDETRFQRLFPLDCPVVFNFHGYTAAIKQLVWERPNNCRFDVNGYREEGTTTTPFDMQVRNRTSRFHIVIQAAQKMATRNPKVGAQAEQIIRKYEQKLREHEAFICREGMDMPEVSGWVWRHGNGAAASSPL